MDFTIKRKVAIGAAGLAILAGAGGTYAATQGSGDERQAFLNDAAGRLKVSPKELSDALQGAFFDRLDAAVAAGRLTKAQADEIKQQSKESGGLPFFGGPKPFFGHRFGGPLMGAIDAAAKYLGLTDAELASQLQSGKSLAQVANDRNKSVDGLKTAIKGAVREKLDAAVKAKDLTQAQEDQALKDLDGRIDDIVNHTGGGPPFGLPFLGAKPPGAPFFGGPFFGPGPPGGPVMGGIDAAAKYLGLTDQQLIAQIRSGKSLAQIAGDRNKPVDGLRAAIKDAVRAKLDAAVKAKKLTQAQEDQILAGLDSHLNDIVNHTGAGRPFLRFRRGGPRLVGPPGGPRWGGGPEGGSGWGGPPPPP